MVPVPFEVMLEVFVTSPVTGSARALFGHTAQLELLLPSGMTYTSQSGDYLVPGQPPTPTVSEPSMALTAFALLALLRGRRRSASERHR
jgi:MYXO-CTERM domain-containing protein